MDRDRRWDRTRLAYDAIVHGVGLSAATGDEAIASAYARDEGDEFIMPTVVGEPVPMADGDAAVHLNFRADRARQLTAALALADFDAFDRGEAPSIGVTTLTEYQDPAELPVRVAFPPLVITADHGNIEEMRDVAGNPQTKHTTSPVPVVLVDDSRREARLHDGILADVAPTLCELLGIPPGPEMTGTSLLRAP
jgi:bisphosphoglycerate-independent phosphoglycerate mutase (AlkP superfamily)